MADVLREVVGTRQIPGEPRRRWFACESLDLVVWLGAQGEAIGFQLCYGKPNAERALTWRLAEQRLTHMAVDDGESVGLQYKASPILIPDGGPDSEKLVQDFLAAATALPVELQALVIGHIQSAFEARKSTGLHSAAPGAAQV